ncbi:MAG: adenosylmethionine--8-amino-7-oxononanoate transaminase [Pseudolabrys sp.]|nr:adenosylmethionine--8-amino-7-oxononanoate transaminase [Pseudolabrys sp.]MDP2295331.1 adenosylmethionine--8-amino-7-oxononanoate transaminase [Pseudolabrys sp.]
MAEDSSKTQRAPGWTADGTGHVWRPYAQMKTANPPLPVVRTRGSRIVLADGRELVDGIASWWTACHGYNHPHIRQAVERQLAEMPHVMLGGLLHEPAVTLARRLAAMLPGDLDHVFFSDSGSVSVEVALKMALQFWINRGVKGRSQFVAFKGGYHGDTTGAMAVSDSEDGMHALFAGLLPRHHLVDLPDSDERLAALDGLLAQRGGDIAGIIVEPLVQGAGGMKFHDPAVLKRLRALADKYDVLLIFDEIFTGFGRTGTMFACEQANVVPDIITLSKALTGGTVGLAATVATKKVFDAFWSDDSAKALMHGPSYMANALACAAANASLDLFKREPRLRQVGTIAAQLEQGLAPCRQMPGVKDVRVMGAIGVVEMESVANLNALRARFVDESVFIRPFGNVVYLTPAFTIAADELDTLTSAIVKIVRTL